jgi:hypothetical protein
MEPKVELAAWGALVCIAGIAALATMLGSRTWLSCAVACGVGSLIGLSAGYLLWWPADPIAGPWVPISILVGTAFAVLLAAIAAFVVRGVRLTSDTIRRVARLALLACVAFGPVVVTLTPSLVRRRIERNDRAAVQRFHALKAAAEHTAAKGPGRQGVCDGFALRQQYFGPSFPDHDWRRIVGNYVTQNGYSFMVYCREAGGYTIHAIPSRPTGQGTREFCTDESGTVGCGMQFNGSRNACTPCSQ